MSVLDLARAEIRVLTPYSSARMEAGTSAVMLNANESPWPPMGAQGTQELNRYPSPQPEGLCNRLAQLYGVRPNQLLIGRGSDEAIDLLVRAFCRPGRDAIMICPPTFGMYEVCAGVQDAAVVRVPLDDSFALDADAVLTAWSPAVKVLFVCSPNNPTGRVVPLDVIEYLARSLDDRALVVIDEAYIEFADTDSATSLLSRCPNLGVLRTLSKAWALAGARIGALLADPDVIALLRRIMPPYPLPTPCVAAAMQALGDEGEACMRSRVTVIARERERMRTALQTVPGVREVLPSQANFLTVRCVSAAAIVETLADNGIVVRDVSRYPGLANSVRVSVGTPEENTRVLDVLARQGAVA